MNISVPGLLDNRVAVNNLDHLFKNKKNHEKVDASNPWFNQEGSKTLFKKHSSNRPTGKVDTIILQHRESASQLKLNQREAHFTVRQNGEIIYNQDIESVIQGKSNEFAIYIEFECCGLNPNASQHHALSRQAIIAGRRLVSHLSQFMPQILNIQTSAADKSQQTEQKLDSSMRDIWINIGTWASSTLGLQHSGQKNKDSQKKRSYQGMFA